MASITGDKDPVVDGELGRHSLTNCDRQLDKYLQSGVRGDVLM